MDIQKIASTWKSFVSRMNSKGVPIPMIRYKGEGNPALTVFVIASVLVAIGIVGKMAGLLGGIDMNNALQFFQASSVLFFGHSWVHKDAQGNSTTLDGGDGSK